MFEDSKCLKIINLLIAESKDNELMECLPISVDDLVNSETLCEMIIDCIGDVYVRFGFDEQYYENEYGKDIRQTIDFVAQCNGDTPDLKES